MARVKTIESIAQEEALEHMRESNKLELRIKEEQLRKAVAEAETAELIRESVRKHGAREFGQAQFPEIKSS